MSIGGGPRGQSQAMAEMELLRRHRADFERIATLGGKYDIQTVIVERNGEDSLGRGNAWGEDQGSGTANTGAEDGSRGGYLDHPRRLKDFIAQHRPQFKQAAKDHPVLDTLLDRSVDGSCGTRHVPVTDRATLTRAQQGREANQKFRQVLEHTRKDFPFYKLHVMTGTSVEKVDVSSPHQPRLTLADASTGAVKGVLSADTVRLNTGTTLANPIKDAQVNVHAFVQAMDTQALERFMSKRDLLDADGQVKPGTTLALGGSGLSAYDQLLALVPLMTLFERDDDTPVGYRVSEEAKQKYQGAITFISNTRGKWIPPRHAHEPAWKQVEDPLGDIREQHALFLHHQGEEVFGSWGVLTDASVALSLGLTPKDVRQEGLGTEELLQAQHAGTAKAAAQLAQARQLDGEDKRRAIDESTQTLEGARRQAHLSTILGLGLSRDPQQALESMSKDAPLTHEGNAGYGIHRAQLKGITEPGTDLADDNQAFIRRFDAVMRDVTSSPMFVHDTVALLFEAGIARHQAGSYEKLDATTGDGKPLGFTADDGTRSCFDAFIVSPTFDRRAEPALMSLSGQIKPADPRIPDIGEVRTHRRLVSKDGTATQVEDHSLNGKGAVVPGTRSKVSVFSTDVNNRESAFDVATGMAYRRMAQEHLAAAGVEDPRGEVERLYEQLVPSDEAHEREVARFAPHFDSATIKAAYLASSEEAAGDDAEDFARLAKVSRTGSTVKTRAALFERPLNEAVRRRISPMSPPQDPQVTANHAQASMHYADALAGRPSYAPASNADYRKRFVDLSLKTHERVYQQALALAEKRLKDGDVNKRRFPPCPIL